MRQPNALVFPFHRIREGLKHRVLPIRMDPILGMDSDEVQGRILALRLATVCWRVSGLPLSHNLHVPNESTIGSSAPTGVYMALVALSPSECILFAMIE